MGHDNRNNRPPQRPVQTLPTGQEHAANAKHAQNEKPPLTDSECLATAKAAREMSAVNAMSVQSNQYTAPGYAEAQKRASETQGAQDQVAQDYFYGRGIARGLLDAHVRVGDKVKCPECKGEGAIYGTASGRVVLCGLCKGARVATVMA